MRRANGLRRLREARLLTQGDLARAIGARQASVSAWERGEVRPRVAMMARLCGALDVTPEELVAALDEAPSAPGERSAPPPAPPGA